MKKLFSLIVILIFMPVTVFAQGVIIDSPDDTMQPVDTIAGFVFYDTNNNGKWDAETEERATGNLHVNLVNVLNKDVGAEYTNEVGIFRFTEVSCPFGRCGHRVLIRYGNDYTYTHDRTLQVQQPTTGAYVIGIWPDLRNHGSQLYLSIIE